MKTHQILQKFVVLRIFGVESKEKFTKMDGKQKIWIGYEIELFIVLKKLTENAYKNWLRVLKGESTRSEDMNLQI